MLIVPTELPLTERRLSIARGIQQGASICTGHSPKAVSMLDQRRRQWANSETALGEGPVFAGMHTLLAERRLLNQSID